MISTPKRYKLPSSCANMPSDVSVTVNINAEFNSVAANRIIECFSRNVVTEYYQGSEPIAVYTAPPFFAETLPGPSHSSLPRLPLHMLAQAIIPTFIL
jgi:hypothetical protein